MHDGSQPLRGIDARAQPGGSAERGRARASSASRSRAPRALACWLAGLSTLASLAACAGGATPTDTGVSTFDAGFADATEPTPLDSGADDAFSLDARTLRDAEAPADGRVLPDGTLDVGPEDVDRGDDGPGAHALDADPPDGAALDAEAPLDADPGLDDGGLHTDASIADGRPSDSGLHPDAPAPSDMGLHPDALAGDALPADAHAPDAAVDAGVRPDAGANACIGLPAIGACALCARARCCPEALACNADPLCSTEWIGPFGACLFNQPPSTCGGFLSSAEGQALLSCMLALCPAECP